MTEPSTQAKRIESWIAAGTITVLVGFASWTVHELAVVGDSLRSISERVSVNRENLDQLRFQVNESALRDANYVRETLHGLEERVLKLEDKARK